MRKMLETYFVPAGINFSLSLNFIYLITTKMTFVVSSVAASMPMWLRPNDAHVYGTFHFTYMHSRATFIL